MELELRPDFDKVYQRYEAFWNRSVADRPLVCMTLPRAPVAGETPPASFAREYPDHRARWLDFEARVEQTVWNLEHRQYLGDALPTVFPNLGPEIFSAWCGCGYEFGEHTTWSTPCIEEWDRDALKARLDLEESEATFLLAEKELGRTQRLHQRKVMTLEDLDTAEERFSVARARVAAAGKTLELAGSRYQEDQRQAKAEVARAESALKNARVQLSYATITSPIDGVIASVSTEEGETVAAAMQAPTFVTVIDLDRLQVDAFVDEVDIGKVQVGQLARFTVDAFPANEFEGRVAAIYPKAIIQDNVVNYDVVIQIETPYHGLLRPEMTASVTIFQEERQGVLAIPTRAVRRERGRTLVYVLEDGGTEPRDVRLGWRDGPWVEVASGLQEGETVLLETPEPNANPTQNLP